MTLQPNSITQLSFNVCLKKYVRELTNPLFFIFLHCHSTTLCSLWMIILVSCAEVLRTGCVLCVISKSPTSFSERGRRETVLSRRWCENPVPGSSGKIKESIFLKSNNIHFHVLVGIRPFPSMTNTLNIRWGFTAWKAKEVSLIPYSDPQNIDYMIIPCENQEPASVWYALQTFYQKELEVEAYLKENGYTPFIPRLYRETVNADPQSLFDSHSSYTHSPMFYKFIKFNSFPFCKTP